MDENRKILNKAQRETNQKIDFVINQEKAFSEILNSLVIYWLTSKHFKYLKDIGIFIFFRYLNQVVSNFIWFSTA